MSIYRMRTEFGKHLKIILGLVAAVFIVGAVWQFGAAPPGVRGRDEERKKPIATVNGMEISQAEFDAAWVSASRNAAQSGMRSTLQMANLRAQIFAQLVQSRLTMAAAKSLGVNISDADVEREVDKLVVEYLRNNRRLVLGTLTDAQEKKDPREDQQYKSELARSGMSIAQQEQIARSLAPEGTVRSALAAEAVEKAIKARFGKVTDKDVTDSYNVYRVRQIVLLSGSLPEEQLAERAKKIHEKAKAGEDFAKLARENSEGPFKEQGGEMEYSFDSQWLFPPEVRKSLESLKPGQISDVIETDRGVFVVKLEGVTAKLPEKFDAEVKKERREQIQQTRQMMAQMEFQQEIRKKADVKVHDDEMAGYWNLMTAQEAGFGQPDYKKHTALAMKAFERKIKTDPGNDWATAKLAEIYKQEGKNKEATRLLYQLLDSPTSTAQGADLRIMLGDLLAAGGKPEDKDAAIEQYKKASDAAINDRMIHEQLVAKYQEMGRSDLVEYEKQWMSDFDKRMAEYEAQQRAAQERQREQSKPKPEQPRPGG